MNNIEKLRKDLEAYCGTAMFNGFPMAVVELGEVESASEEQLIIMARQAGLDIRKYTY